LTVLGIAFSLLLLTLMMTIWRAFYLDEGSAESAERLVVRHRVSFDFQLARTLSAENWRRARSRGGGSNLLVRRDL
jgi:hypothetical protein